MYTISKKHTLKSARKDETRLWGLRFMRRKKERGAAEGGYREVARTTRQSLRDRVREHAKKRAGEVWLGVVGRRNGNDRMSKVKHLKEKYSLQS